MDTPPATGAALTLSRFIPAPPQAVFAAWIEPEKVKAWFGPYGMTCPVAEIEPRAGGRHFTLMRDAAGTDHPNPQIIEAIVPNRRLVLRVPPEGSSCPLPGAVGTLDFTAVEDGTRFELRWDHPTPEMRAQHETMGFHPGWQQTVDKLSAFAAAPDVACGPQSPPTQEHGWLHRLIGDWTYEQDCMMPDGSTARVTGTERVRALGPWWVVGESEGGMPGGGRMLRAALRQPDGTWTTFMEGRYRRLG